MRIEEYESQLFLNLISMITLFGPHIVNLAFATQPTIFAYQTDTSQHSNHTMTPKAYILELPTEMLVHIANALKDGSDPLALRSTCTNLERATNDAFAAKYFAVRTHLFTRYGLQTLVDITKHPYLGRKVQKIELIVKDLRRGSFGPYDDYGDIPWTSDPYSTEAQKLAARRYAEGRDQGWASWDADAEALLDESRVATTLGEAFAALASVDASVEMDINGEMRNCYYEDPPAPYGMKHLLAGIGNGLKQQDLRNGELDFALQSVVTAMGRTGLKCHTFSIGDHYEGNLTSSAFEFMDAGPLTVHPCLASMTKLQLCFGYGLPVDTEAQESTIIDFGRACVNLRELRLGWNGYESMSKPDALAIIGEAFTSRHLNSFHLMALSSDAEGYIKFLDSRRESLTKLTLNNLLLPESQCWSTVLRWILHHAQLEYLKLDTLAQYEPYAVVNDDDDNETFVFKGDVEGVKEQLRGLLPKMRYKNYD
ncbi:hypothetical protein LTR56_011862 [Elasticomyces elasticus]|nr:hypothetical protein LTR56_011862 [Elasticomyces elasticus]KAK3666409.1 hypothetical protein LTR22_002714 [Elasticomyces elasticus]KAK4931229.1 hypothetical protein LTR49_002287 [Elasticomyces elasticus]KAK5767840.1 hypothetical protein LTS12_001992 [Elasticomyces elasticus]